ncbi:hypothetical protein ACVWW1_001581 [Bradyrhizobium sp. JR3.5]
MNSVCIRRPAEFSGYSRLRSMSSRSAARQLLQDLFLVLLVEAFQQLDGVVGFELADALGNGLRLEFLEDLLADRLVDLVERREVEVRTRDLDQGDAVVRLQRLDQVAEIGLVQFRHHLAQQGPVGGANGPGDLRDEFGAELALLVPHRHPGERIGLGGFDNVDILGHAVIRRFDRRGKTALMSAERIT